MDEELTILRMARDKTLPNPLGETSGIDIDRVAELFDAGLLKGINASTYDAKEFLDVRIPIQDANACNS